jgi:peptidyl-prolyl cis-trans isomerase A (cyclophilin A)/peptidyl-prolyl cis-trans isomerase B (cyclophilin B)
MLVRFAAALLLFTLLFSAGCGKGDGEALATQQAEQPAVASGAPAEASAAAASPVVGPIDVCLKTSEGDIIVRLNPEKAPRTVENFLENYALEGFYNETIFHHVEAGKMIIGGGFTQDLAPRPMKIPVLNEADNGLSNRRGTIAMVRDMDSAHSATCQFFINLGDNRELDYQGQTSDEAYGYCVFGEVVQGLDIADRIAKQPAAPQETFANLPEKPVVVHEVTVMR